MGQSKQTTESKPSGPGVKYFASTVNPAARALQSTPFEAYTGQFAPEMSQYSTQAADIYSGMAGQDQTQQLLDTTQALYNPYQQNVIDASLAQMGRQQQQALTGLESQLAGSGAFGSRGEVARGEFAAGNLASQNQLIADMMQSGYSEAQARAMGVLQQQQAQQGAAAAGLTGVGGMEQALQGADIAGQYGEFIRRQDDPYKRLAALAGASSAAPVGTTQTETYKPGLFDYVGVAAQAAGPIMAAMSDVRLKTDIKPAGARGDVKFYTWEWNEDGQRIADPRQPKFGVIADELKQTHPHLVKRGADGFLRVNYAELADELGA